MCIRDSINAEYGIIGHLDDVYPGLSVGLTMPEIASMADDIKAAEEGIRKYISYVHLNVIEPDSLTVDSDKVFAEGTAAIQKVLNLYHLMLPVLYEKERAHLEKQIFSRNLIVAVIFFTFFLSLLNILRCRRQG
eukprot:TRINITY_DN37610_c0_g1_i1.p1 TRINITY_DN37610_c0_g1~~TRINITY_DN37610_c0_g1_i1.p1  ORF type:complete len:134 (+),score=5.64 TRINITY_DN37610_c0_g1_i1:85-486(+)